MCVWGQLSVTCIRIQHFDSLAVGKSRLLSRSPEVASYDKEY
jgi:hypothetical protein